MSPRLLVLSHPLRPDAPVWPGNPPAVAVELVDPMRTRLITS